MGQLSHGPSGTATCVHEGTEHRARFWTELDADDDAVGEGLLPSITVVYRHREKTSLLSHGMRPERAASELLRELLNAPKRLAG